MRKKSQSIDSIKEYIRLLIGKNINMRVCRGRKQVKKYSGVIENTFPSIFVVKLSNTTQIPNSLSYSYNDVLCGEVKVEEVV